MIVNASEVGKLPIEFSAAVGRLHCDKLNHYFFSGYVEKDGVVILHSVTGYDAEKIIHIFSDGSVNVTYHYKNVKSYLKEH